MYIYILYKYIDINLILTLQLRGLGMDYYGFALLVPMNLT